MGGLIERANKLYDDYGNVFKGPIIKLENNLEIIIILKIYRCTN